MPPNLAPVASFFARPEYLWAAAAGVFAAVLTGTLVVWALIHRHERREEAIAAARREEEAERERQRRADEAQAAEDRRAEDHARHVERTTAEAAHHGQIMGQLQAAIAEARRFPTMVAAQYERTEVKVDALAKTTDGLAAEIKDLRERIQALEVDRRG